MKTELQLLREFAALPRSEERQWLKDNHRDIAAHKVPFLWRLAKRINGTTRDRK
jgi:hypothetical protein